MENRFRAVAGSTRAPEPRHRQFADNARLVQAAIEELRPVRTAQANVLLAGGDELVWPVLQALLGHEQQPITSWSSGQPLALPSLEQRGTLVLHEIGTLGLLEQIQLLEWSERAMGNTRVISTTSAPLLPRVRAGGFIDTLYYRLNTVYVDVTGLEEPV
jgi:sigma54-dependent transcription regulator